MPDASLVKITPSEVQGVKDAGLKDQGVNPRKPSKIFTDYYGSVFLLLMAAYVAGGFFFIKPKIDLGKQIDAETRGLKEEVENDKMYFDGLSGSVAAAQSVAPEILTKVDQALPREASVPDLLVQLSSAAAGTGVVLSNIVFEGVSKVPVSGGGVKPINLTLTVSARDYATFKNFLRALETSLRVFDVQTISFSGFGTDKVNFNLQIKSYYFPTSTEKR